MFHRYIHLTYLISELLDLVDEEQIAFTPAVELSYLNEVEQADLVEEVRVCDATPNLSQAQRLRAISREEGLTPEHIGEILGKKRRIRSLCLKYLWRSCRKLLLRLRIKTLKILY